MEINEKLSKLNGCKLLEIYHAWEMICITFENADENDETQYNLHSQCTFRIVDPKGCIIFGDNDWYGDNENYYEVKLSLINNALRSSKVSSVIYQHPGDLEIILEKDNDTLYRLQLFVNSSSDDEMWRFIEVDDDCAQHWVCYPGYVEEE